MNWMRTWVTLAFVGTVLPMVMGATFSMPNVTPNPGGDKNKLKGNGTWGLAAGEKFVSIVFQATLKNSNPVQITSGYATKTDAPTYTWESNLLVAPATYNPCKSTFYYINALGKSEWQTQTNTNDQTVN